MINDKPMTEIFERVMTTIAHSRDNLFSANHRNAMLRKYGYTEASYITINQLIYGQ